MSFQIVLKMLLKSDYSPHWFKEESHGHNVRQVLKSWVNHMIRIKIVQCPLTVKEAFLIGEGELMGNFFFGCLTRT